MLTNQWRDGRDKTTSRFDFDYDTLMCAQLVTEVDHRYRAGSLNALFYRKSFRSFGTKHDGAYAACGRRTRNLALETSLVTFLRVEKLAYRIK